MEESVSITRDEAIARIKAALKARTGKVWSVTGGRGTAWGWITIRAVKRHAADEWGRLTEEDQTLLAEVLGLDHPVHPQGFDIPASSSFYAEYVDRAEGREPRVYGVQYWD